MAITMTTDISIKSEERPVRILILGGSYGGMAAAMNLSDLCAGKRSRFGLGNVKPGHRIPVEITTLDERDGYCTPLLP